MDTLHYILLFALAFTAGFVDSIVGGGGLIQMPALLVFMPHVAIPSLMGTNKFAAFSGTSVSAIRYTKQVDVPWKMLLPAVITALLFSFLGARLVNLFPKEYFKLIVVILLCIVAVYTFFRKDFGLFHAPKLEGNKAFIYAALAGTTMGLYDGFFGPGTGSFLIVIFISVFGFNFITASASAKLINCATNLAALLYFIFTKQVVYELAIPVAVFNMGGSWIGAKTAIRKGAGFVRIFFLLIVSALIIKLITDLVLA